jgi:putative transposase
LAVEPFSRHAAYCNGSTIGEPPGTLLRLQRRSDGAVSLAGQRFEIPSRYRHLGTVSLRYARWDLTPLPPSGMAPLLAQCIADYAATGLPPAYLPHHDQENSHE